MFDYVMIKARDHTRDTQTYVYVYTYIQLTRQC